MHFADLHRSRWASRLADLTEELMVVESQGSPEDVRRIDARICDHYRGEWDIDQTRIDIGLGRSYRYDPEKPDAFKGAIHGDWVELPTEVLERLISFPGKYVSAAAMDDLLRQNPKLREAFHSWLGRSGPRKIGKHLKADWAGFLNDLRGAEQALEKAGYVVPEDGVIYRGDRYR